MVRCSRGCFRLLSLHLYLFFFSSRRRHTRCGRDWSSDVCSSDLNTTRHRLEWPDGGDAEKLVGISPTRHMHSERVSAEHVRHIKVRQPPPVVDARAFEACPGCLWIPYAIDGCAEPQVFDRLDKILLQLGSAFFIAPVAYPDDFALAFFSGQGAKDPRVRRLVPGPRLSDPTIAGVHIPQHRPKRQHAVIVAKIKPKNGPRVACKAVMGVMKQQLEPAFAAMLANSPNKIGLIPLVNQNEIRTAEYSREIDASGIVRCALKHGVCLGETIERFPAVLRKKILKTPPAPRLIDDHVMSTNHKIGCDAAQKMRVSMVPVRKQRMIEHYYTHRFSSNSSGPRGRQGVPQRHIIFVHALRRCSSSL